MDRHLIQRGLDRTSLPRFLLWLLPWLLLGAWGGISATQLFRDGLYHTALSVSSAPSQPWKRCRPPRRSTRPCPGRRYRW